VSPSALAAGYRSDWQKDRRARVIVNGVPPFVSEPGAPALRELGGSAAAILLHVGRPSREKNRVQTVRVLKAVVERGTDAHLALVGGQGTDSAAIAEEAARLGVADRVHDLGARRDVRQLMSGADALLLTSVREGLPGVVIESLSTGTPVVASALPGVEFIGAELRGVYPVPLTDPDVSWAEAVEAALEKGQDLEWRRSVKREFESSAFSHALARDRHLELYSGKHCG
jgi:glycosyltransferase involved in cell wall biosynthesis